MNASRSYAYLFTIAGLVWVLVGTTVSYAEDLEEAQASPLEFAPLLVLDRDVHFPAPSGEDVLVSSGEYQVAAKEGSLKLVPSDEENLEPIVIQAQTSTHEEKVASPEPRSIPGEGEQHALLLLLPDGHSLQAIGSYSGIQSRHPHKFKFGYLKGLAGKLPTVKSIFTTPSQLPTITPIGAVTPTGTLYIKGMRFGATKGKVELQVSVPFNKKFYVPKGTKTRAGTKKGKKRIQLDVKSWSDTRIKVQIPLIAGVPDHSASFQIFTAKGLGSIGRKVRFYATRGNGTLKYGEKVTSINCSNGANESYCLDKQAGTMAAFEGPCFYGGPKRKDKTITAWHLNCHGAVDWDEGTDRYTIKLKNNWVVEEIKWGWKRSSSSEKLKLPSAKALTKKHKGASSMTIRVPWEVSPGPDWLAYWISVRIKGPVGLPF